MLKVASGNSSLVHGFKFCPFFLFLCLTSFSILWGTCMYVHIYIYIYGCVETVYELPLPPNSTLSEIFLHKSGDVRSVDWIFIIVGPTWRWLGEYVTLDGTFYCLLAKQEVAVAVPGYCHILFLIAFLEEAFIRNIIIIICFNYTNIIFMYINEVINNNLWETPRPYFTLQSFHGHEKEFLRNL